MPSIRRAQIEDAREFNALVNQLGGPNVFRSQFGQYNFTSLIEYSHLALFAPTDDGSCGCFASFSDGILSVGDNMSFDQIIQTLSDLLPCRTTNSLLLNFWALNTVLVESSVGIELLRMMFSLCPEVNYIFWICQATVNPPDFLETNFSRLNLSKRAQSGDHNDPLKKSAVYCLHRSKVLPQLQVRAARVEDNDDLIPILQISNHSNQFISGQEDYYLANLIQLQNDTNKFFVGVNSKTNRPVGMLATSLDINAELLARVFSLDLYPDLIIQPKNEMVIRPHITLLVGDPFVIRGLEFNRVMKHTNTIWINGMKLREKSQGNNINATEYLGLIRNAVNEHTEQGSGSNVRGIIITDCPRNEHDARALLINLREHRISIDAVIEIETVEDDEDADVLPSHLAEGDNDIVGEYLDAIELLRDPFTSTDDCMANDDFLQLHIQWKKIEDDGTGQRTPQKVTDIIISELKMIIALYERENEEICKANQIGPVTNAFAISLFCIDEKYESRSEDLIRVAFEEYPEKDYCILMIPNHRIPSMALVHSMQCPQVRDGVSFDQSLYLIHRHSLLAHDLLRIERIQEIQHESLDPLLQHLDINDYNEVINSLTRSCRDKDVDLANNPAEVAFQILVDRNLVGIICLSRKLTTSEDITSLRENYQLDDIISFERHRSRSQAMITHFLLNPIFYKWSRFIYREVMRYYHKTVLYYQGAKGIQPTLPIVEEMIPVQIRKKEFAKPAEIGVDEGKTTANLANVQCNRPMFVMIKKELSRYKSFIGKRIVVVGGNNAAFKILEQICFASGKHLNNIYLIMDHAPGPWDLSTLPPEQETAESSLLNSIKDNYSGCLSPKDVDDYTQDEIYALGLSNRVTLVQGKLTDIDRKNKAIIISDEVIVEYDVLVLASGVQDISYKQFPSVHSFAPSTLMQKGIFPLGNYHADELALEHLVYQADEPTNISKSNKIVIFGDGIRALCLIGRLEEYGIDMTRVIWLTSKETIPDTNCSEIDSMIETMMKYEWATKITIYKNSKVLDVDLPSESELERSEGTGIIDGVNIRIFPQKNSIMGPKDEFIECSTLLLCANFQCDVDVFTAVNESGLVYDGGVVVNENFMTVDPCIYAVGAFSRYSRRYKGQLIHSRINNRELGEYVAKDIISRHLTQHDPDYHELAALQSEFDNERTPSADKVKFHRFNYPKIFDYHFPASMHYFHCAIPSATQSESFLVTGPSDEMNQRVCALKIAPLGYVSEFVCIQSIFPDTSEYDRNLARYIGCLVGWHESYLNSALFAFESNNVIDWIDFFSEEWVSVLRFDRFPALAELIRNSLYSDKGVISFLDKVMEAADSTTDVEVIAQTRRNILGERGSRVENNTRSVILTYVVDFIRKHKSYLPAFYIPETKSVPSKSHK